MVDPQTYNEFMKDYPNLKMLLESGQYIPDDQKHGIILHGGQMARVLDSMAYMILRQGAAINELGRMSQRMKEHYAQQPYIPSVTGSW